MDTDKLSGGFDLESVNNQLTCDIKKMRAAGLNDEDFDFYFLLGEKEREYLRYLTYSGDRRPEEDRERTVLGRYEVIPIFIDSYFHIFPMKKESELKKENLQLRAMQDAWDYINLPRIVPISYSELLERTMAAEKLLLRLRETGIIQKISGIGGGSCATTDRIDAMQEACRFTEQLKKKNEN